VAKTVGSDVYDYYYNENWQVLEVRKNGSSNPLEQWVWDRRYIDAPVLRWHDSNTDGTVDDTLYATNDANMNVTALVDTITNNVVERYAYDPYGKVTVMDGAWGARASSSYGWDVGHQGLMKDEETGLQNRNRVLHISLGSFVQRDPGSANGANLYFYLEDAPTSNWDWDGKQTQSSTGPSTAPELSIIPKKPRPRECGEVQWTIEWKLSNVTGDGWIIQHVKYNVRVTSCSTGALSKGDSNFREYWEAWPVQAGKPGAHIGRNVQSGTWVIDNKAYTKIGNADHMGGSGCPGAAGTFQIPGEAAFYQGYDLPLSFSLNNLKTYAGYLPATADKPDLPAATTASVAHAISGSWNCCRGGDRTTHVDGTTPSL
jgi:RHS repeat-associated protein